MPDIRVENEVKLYSPGGPFAFDGDDPSVQMTALRSLFVSEGFSCSEPVTVPHTDYYYGDVNGDFDRQGILLRYRDLGEKASLTMKLPSIREGMGLSRREIEGDIVNDSRFDRWKSVQDYASEFYGEVEIAKLPKLRVDVVRGSLRMTSDVRRYTFTFDKVVYEDPSSGTRSMPCYEMEFESLDEAIDRDVKMVHLVSLLTDRYLFEEERVSKYARGMAFLRSVR